MLICDVFYVPMTPTPFHFVFGHRIPLRWVVLHLKTQITRKNYTEKGFTSGVSVSADYVVMVPLEFEVKDKDKV